MVSIAKKAMEIRKGLPCDHFQLRPFRHKEKPETLGIQTSLIYLIVTNSSEPVGWMATVLSKSALVAPILIATEKP